MNVQFKRRNDVQIDNRAVNETSEKLGLHSKIVEVLFSRGISDEESIRRFLNPSPDNFYDPFLMKDMRRASERLEQAIANDEVVVVYGDYDADGICAASILSLYLRSRGLNVRTHIPNRIGEGYGLNVASLEKIIEEVCPDLILTCDCGISGHAEVEFALDLGVDVIVTDHHEVADTVPDCIVVNPKQSDCDYPCKTLCGAGVALKLVEAMGGRKVASDYYDLACVATIADLVPLLDENRLIVQLGLAALAEGKNIGIQRLLASQGLGDEVTSTDIAFKIAPRINAAGRIGDAYRAFEMLISDDFAVIDSIIEEINDANGKRKLACDKLYDEAVADLRYENLVDSRCIVLSSPEWEKGITGIVAARLTNDFKRPSFILVPSGDGIYKGTCRSVENINIYEALSAVSDTLTEFGGHSQAAGFSIRTEKLAEFKQRMNEYLGKFPTEYFMPYCTYDIELNSDEVSVSLIKELEKLEPTGNGFVKPLFKISATDLSVSLCKSNVNHSSITTKNGFQIFAFNFYNKNHYAVGDGRKDMIVELQLNAFNNREYPRGVLKEIGTEKLYVNEESAKSVYVKYTDLENCEGKAVYTEFDKTDLKSIVGNAPFGTLVIAFDKENYDDFNSVCGKSAAVLHEYMFPSSKNNYTRIIVAPDFDSGLMLSAYNKIVLLDKPLSAGFIKYLNAQTNAEIFVPKQDDRKRLIESLDTSRLTLGRYYDYIRKNADVSAANVYAYTKSIRNRVKEADLSELMLAINVFSELGLVKSSVGRYRLSIVQGEKRELKDSKILSLVENLKNSL